MRTRSVASTLSFVTVFASMALAGALAACSSAGENADPSFGAEDDAASNSGSHASSGSANGGDESEAGATGASTTQANGGGSAGSGGGTAVSKNDWTNVYASLFASGTEGHCGNSGCHDTLRHGFSCGTTGDACYQGMIAAGLIDATNPAGSELGDPQNSPLSWFSGTGMPADAQKVDKTATATVIAFLNAGAPNHGVLLGADAGTGDDEGDSGTVDVMDAGMDATTHADAGSKDAGSKDAGSKDAGSKDAGHDAGKDAGHDAGAAFATWTELYTAYFGPSTPGHCGNSGCHEAKKSGFECGTTAAACYEGMVAAGLIDTANPSASSIADPANSPLSWYNQGGEMPKDEPQTLPAGTAAIQAWIAAGASKD